MAADRELEKKLRRIRALRKMREAEQLRLAAELHAHERRMRESMEARQKAERFLEGDLPDGGLLAGQGLRIAAENARIEAGERRIVNDISARNVQSRSVRDKLHEVEVRLSSQLERQETDALLFDAIATRAGLDRETG